MRREPYFENVSGAGSLYLEYIFLEYEYEPIYFTCVDDAEQIYLCLCSEIRGKQKWIIARSTCHILENMIDQKSDMASALCVNEKVIVIDRNIEGIESSCLLETRELDELDLPKRGVMLRCDKEAALRYVLGKRQKTIPVEYQITADFSNGYKEAVNSYNIIVEPVFYISPNDILKRYMQYASKTMDIFIRNWNVRYNAQRVEIYTTESDRIAVEGMEIMTDNYLIAA